MRLEITRKGMIEVRDPSGRLVSSNTVIEEAIEDLVADAEAHPEIETYRITYPSREVRVIPKAVVVPVPATSPQWNGTTIPAITFTDGAGDQYFSFGPYLTMGNAATVTPLDPASTESNQIPATLPAQLSITNEFPPRLKFTNSVGGAYGPTNFKWKAASSAEADWQSRIAGTGVVWYHDFRNAAEVNAFRWTGGYGGGNDPNALGSNGQYVTQVADGPTGYCLEIRWPSAGEFGNSHWWRPMSPIVGTGNGRGVDDPGANGTITPRAYAATNGGSQIANFGDVGYYGEQGGAAFDGTEYYLQMRIKMDPARITAGLNPGGNQFGKLCYFTRTDQSLTTQEINTESYQNGAAGRNYFSMYRSGSPPLESDAPGQGNQPGNQNGIVWFDNRDGSAANAFYWPNPAEWVTVLYHIVPKLTYTTVVQVWIARAGETSYTKIWDMNTVNLDYGANHPYGHNAVLLTAYQNQLSALNGFYHRYTQLIFSKETIPCPQV